MKQTFKEYYAQNPEFRQRHVEKVQRKIECPDCKRMIASCNMYNHKRTKKHAELVKTTRALVDLHTVINTLMKSQGTSK